VTAEGRGRPGADVLLLAGGAALVASAFLHWLSDGPGSSLRGHDLIDALVALGDTLPGLSAARLTVLWYLVPGLGAATWVAAGLAGTGSALVRSLAWSALAVTTVVITAFARLAGTDDLGPGVAVSGFGALALVAGATLARR
jgi:hypothetical protein